MIKSKTRAIISHQEHFEMLKSEFEIFLYQLAKFVLHFFYELKFHNLRKEERENN